jgi:hypothetical protein
MPGTYFKRYRMELDLRRRLNPIPPTAPGYLFLPWDGALLEAHADVKYRSFRDELDASVFPCLAVPEGCLQLMREIAEREGFLPESTWLAAYHPIQRMSPQFCGTIQGVVGRNRTGNIQNVGVVPGHRGRGLGSGLIARALHGFRVAGLERALLEVTVRNVGAVRLYRRLGFRHTRTVYKSAEIAYT